jgi:hypothetical protein
VWIVEPLKRAEFSALAIDGSIVVAFFHWFLPHCNPIANLWDGSNHGGVASMLKISSAANALARPNPSLDH